MKKNNYTGLEIAIIGMNGKFPGGENLDEFWHNLKQGKESITQLSDEELRKAGVNNNLLSNPSYVKANSNLKEKEYFDSKFFNYRPDEAKLMNPQTRVFHECVWKAIEDAGCNIYDKSNRIGLFSGGSHSIDWDVFAKITNLENLVDDFSCIHLRNITFLSSRVSHALNLRGPAVYVNTACSTSLVAVHQACESLLMSRCNIAVAGGVTIQLAPKQGYMHVEGIVMSKDGHNRTFDENASGTVMGEGAGVVVLKKLKNAIEDGDNIYAIIKGTGINNDGSEKAGYTAPSINGQTEAILMAQKWAKISSESITYIEAHGTATQLGDPVEVTALKRVFGKSKERYCALGSVKSNIGHLDCAAGVAGLIKTALALKNKQIPPTLNFKSLNPKIDLTDSPFYVNTELKDWKNSNSPLRAGVSAFGIGGTNAHIVLEEAPDQTCSDQGRYYQLFVVSAKSDTALKRNIENLVEYLNNAKEEEFSDIAYTLQVGRVPFKYRKMIVCSNKDEAITKFKNICTQNKFLPVKTDDKQKVVFMFSGQGSQYINMCRDLYEQENYFTKLIDQCFDIVYKISGKDLKSVIFPNSGDKESDLLDYPEFAQPSLFIIEYALANLLINWGIKPDYLIGHSLGEYVAACLSSVFSLEEVLKLVVKRSELINTCNTGSMLSISISGDKLKSYLKLYPELSIALVNSNELYVVAGIQGEIKKLESELVKNKINCKLIHDTLGSHSKMMDSILDDFEKEIQGISMKSPQIPIISNVSGKEVSGQEIITSQYWVHHMRNTVRFCEGIEKLMAFKDAVFIEVGPGVELCTFVRSNKSRKEGHKIVNLVRHPSIEGNDLFHLLTGIGKLWINGIEPDWSNYYKNELRKKVSLPTYSFDKIKYPVCIDIYKSIASVTSGNVFGLENDLSNWFHVPSWEVSPIYTNISSTFSIKKHTIIFLDEHQVGNKIKVELEKSGEDVIIAKIGKEFKQINRFSFELNIDKIEDYFSLYEKCEKSSAYRFIFPSTITDEIPSSLSADKLKSSLKRGFYNILNIVKSISEYAPGSNIEIISLTNNQWSVLKSDNVSPETSLLEGALKVIPKEYAKISCRNIDFPFTEVNEELIKSLTDEIIAERKETAIAYRNQTRYVQTYKQVHVESDKDSSIPFNAGGVYLITGGIGGIGLTMARYIAESVKEVKLILLGRKEIPNKNDWKNWLENNNKNTPYYNVISELLEIEKIGGEIHYFSADITNKDELKIIIDNVTQEIGEITGVIHTAGAPDYAGAIFKRNAKEDENIFAAKLYGTINLQETLSKSNLNFFVLCSSLSTVEGAFGQIAYVSANLFIESYVRYCNSIFNSNMKFIAWNAWQDVGMAVEAAKNKGLTDFFYDSISPKEGCEIFLRTLNNNIPGVIISKRKLSAPITEQIDDTDSEKNEEDAIKNKYLSSGQSSTSSIDEALIEIVKDFFGITDVDADSDFFELGGNSLTAITLIGKIHKIFDIELSIKQLFNNSSLSDISKLILSLKNNEDTTKSGSSFSEIPKAEAKEYYKISSAQKRMLFLYELEKESTAYNLPQVLNLKGNLEIERIEKAFIELINRHESLRTSFIEINNEYYQKTNNHYSFEAQIIEHTNDDLDKVISGFIQPFDLKKGPLLRVGIIKISAQEYVLILDLHHIISDGISQAILVKEFMSLYNKEELSGLELQYKDYSEWQQSNKQQKNLDKQREFWLNEFKDGVPEKLNLPTDFPRPASANYKGSSSTFNLSLEETSKLKEISESEGATLFMVLLSILNILLSKLSNQDTIVVGAPVGGRHHINLDKIIGIFVNTVPLVNHPRGDLSFKEFVSEVKAKTLACFENQKFQFEQLISELKINREVSHNPLFDVAFTYNNYENSNIEISGLSLNPFYKKQNETKFDITLLAFLKEGQLLFDIEYSTVLFKMETIERIKGYFKQIVAAIINNKDIKLSKINILPYNEEQKLLVEFNNTVRKYNKQILIHQLFEEQTALFPTKKAVMYDGIGASYEEINQKANQLAGYLNGIGVSGETIVGILLEPSINLVVSILATLKAGAAYLPLDISNPINRIKNIIADSGVDYVISGAGVSNNLEVKNNIDLESLDLTKFGTENKPICYSEDKLLYVIYTSGSTGKPKGVKVSHTGFLNLLQAHVDIFGNSEEDNMTLVASSGFDAMAFELWPSLTCGATLYIANPEIQVDPLKMKEWLLDNKITITYQPTFIGECLIEEQWDPENTDLKFLRVAGDRLEKYPSKEIPFKLFNLYGPTEDTVWTTFAEISPNSSMESHPVIGKPINNKQIYILGNNNNLQPIGVPGEICISGDGLAIGYLNNKEQNLEKFVQAPFIQDKRMYKTGDVGRWLPDGNIEFIGRIDDQIKIRGYRIELKEVEFHISNYKEIIKVKALLRNVGSNQSYLVAYYTSNQDIDPSKLRKYLSNRVPNYMIPSFFKRVNEFHLTINGKVNVKKLPEIDTTYKKDYIAPLNKEEKVLAKVWEKVLGFENISISDNFFSIGGDSIKSIQICSKMQDEGYKLMLKDLFTYQTIELLAKKIKKEVNISCQSLISGEVPLAPIQKWFFNTSDIDQHHFNQSVMLYFNGGISESIVKNIFEKLFLHHDALRIVFKKSGEIIKQINLGKEQIPIIEVVDFTKSAYNQDDVLSFTNKIQSGIDINSGPLLKLGLIHVKKGSYLLIAVHHLIIDGISWRILFEDIENLYQQIQNKKELTLPLKTDSCLHWSNQLETYIEGNDYKNAEKYWGNVLQKKCISIERDVTNGENYYRDAINETFQLNAEITKKLLTEINSAFNITINDILLTALMLSINEMYGKGTVCIDTEGHGREEIFENVNLNRTVGWFTTIYPIFLEINESSLEKAIVEVKEALRKIPNNGFDYLFLKYKKKHQLDIHSKINFNYLGQFDTDLKNRSFSLVPELRGNDVSVNRKRVYDWEISSIIVGGLLKVSITYSKQQYYTSTIQNLNRHFSDNVIKLVELCCKSKFKLTPSDLTFKGLSIDELNELQEHYEIQDICTLSPMQKGMLFHSLLEVNEENYFEQITYQINGYLDIIALEKSFNNLIATYDALRAIFFHEEFDRPIQLILKNPKVDFVYIDIQEECLNNPKSEVVKSYLEKDRNKAFNLSKDISIRATVLQIDKDEYEFIWSYHHILMDGWCIGIIIKSFIEYYIKNLNNEKISIHKSNNYSKYIEWIEQIDEDKSLKFWESYLEGFMHPTSIPKKQTSDKLQIYDQKAFQFILTKDITKSLTQLSIENEVTLNNIIQVAWGILLSKYSNANDILFGAVVSGRPSEIIGVEDIVGLFINTIPVRIKISPNNDIQEVIRNVKQNTIDCEPHHYSSLAEIQSQNKLGINMIDHIMIFENYPLGNEIEKSYNNHNNLFTITNVQAFEQTNYDLVLLIFPGEEIVIKFAFNSNRYEKNVIEEVAKHFRNIIEQLISDTTKSISSIELISKAEEQDISDFIKNSKSELQIDFNF